MTVGELEERMSYRELMEWVVLYKIEHEEHQEAEMDALLTATHSKRTQ